MHFMCDVLEVLSILSKKLQADRLTLSSSLDALEVCYLGLIALKTRPGKFNHELCFNILNLEKKVDVH